MRSKESATDRLFGILANPTRREILDALQYGERSAGEIAARFAMARPSVSAHLAVLRTAGLVVERRDGRHLRYTLDPAPLTLARDWLHPYERFWRDHLDTLHALLNETESP